MSLSSLSSLTATPINPATHREESDSMGVVPVPHDCYYGAQTARSLHFFAIGEERMPAALIKALAQLKKACALANKDLGKLSDDKCALICQAAEDIIAGERIPHAKHFPLSVWQTGSGTQTNMNINEVIANRTTEISFGKIVSAYSACSALSLCSAEEARKKLVHANDDVNMSQSSNDVFPTAMHVAAVTVVQEQLLPEIHALREALHAKVREFAEIVKIGRTHLMDATPLTLGQEMSGYVAMLSADLQRVEGSLVGLQQLAIGGTAVGTGLNTHVAFSGLVCSHLTQITGSPWYSAENKFAALAAHGELVAAHGALKGLATSLLKIANDVRWLASGPRCGLGELRLPENEPGSSIMSGKVNPTQCEAMTMVCAQVIANDSAITFAASQGNFELNVYKPLIIHNFLHSTRLLADAMRSFNKFCVQGMTANREVIDKHMHSSLMLVTALNPHIGYDKAAKVAKKAFAENITLKEAAVQLQFVTEDEFDHWVVPKDMTQPK